MTVFNTVNSKATGLNNTKDSLQGYKLLDNTCKTAVSFSRPEWRCMLQVALGSDLYYFKNLKFTRTSPSPT